MLLPGEGVAPVCGTFRLGFDFMEAALHLSGFRRRDFSLGTVRLGCPRQLFQLRSSQISYEHLEKHCRNFMISY